MALTAETAGLPSIGEPPVDHVYRLASRPSPLTADPQSVEQTSGQPTILAQCRPS